jgi:predicted O-methyltransferase YrrM
MLPSVLRDDNARRVAYRLHALSEQQEAALPWRLFGWHRQARARLGIRPPDFGSPRMRSFLGSRLVALDRAKCELCYLLCRVMRARRVVEVGTSFGASTIYLAAAVRENNMGEAQGGKVIGTELEPAKAAAARTNLAQAGLLSVTDVREGDFRETLQAIDAPIDFALLDIWAPLAEAAIELLAPRLRPGAIVACDNIERYWDEYRGYRAFVRDPVNGFSTSTLPLDGGFSVSIKRS